MKKFLTISVFLAIANMVVYSHNLVGGDVQLIHQEPKGCVASDALENRAYILGVTPVSASDCQNAWCEEDYQSWQYYCVKWSGNECGSGWNWGDDNFRKKRIITYWKGCDGPQRNRVSCQGWIDDGCCSTHQGNSAPNQCYSDEGFPECGSQN